jgi:thiol-disulfide isomerase/thioredoxin
MMKSEIKTAIILGIVIAAGVSLMSVYLGSIEQEAVQEFTVSPVDKSNFKVAPEIVGIAEYINTTPKELNAKIQDSVVLYDIWTYSCINCIRTLPFITAWDDKYSDQGLLIIGIHSPEFEFEKDPVNVMAAMEKHGIEYPVVMDNDMDTWKAFENRYWPRKYIADHEGYIRYNHIGEGAYQETERVIQELLAERAFAMQSSMPSQDLVELESFQHTSSRTPELYLGYKLAAGRSQLGNDEGFRPNQSITYGSIPDTLDTHKFYMVGTWQNGPESMRLESSSGAIHLQYFAKEVNIVTEGVGTIEVYLDGEPITTNYQGYSLDDYILEVSEPGLYNIVTSDVAGTHMLELRITTPGVEIFTYTFG